MKFCPQCGTYFDPETRFCAECGFDRSLAESFSPTPPLAPEVLITDEKTDTSEQVEVKKPQPKIESTCPQCGTELSSGDRFCSECGFDTLGICEVKAEIPQVTEEPEVEEIVIKPDPVEETILTPSNKQFCPQCGSGIDADERFCQECGFDTSVNKDFAEVVLPAVPAFMVEETIVPESQVEKSVPAQVNNQLCPQCGSGIEDNERFCQECGFDTSVNKDFAEVVPPAVPQSMVEETILPESPAEEIIPEQDNKQLCPHCGSGIEDNERFCHNCGFDTKPEVLPVTEPEEQISPKPIVPEPEQKFITKSVVPEVDEQFNPKPIVPEPEEQFIPKPVVTEPEPEPVTYTPIYNQNPQEVNQTTQQKGKKSWLKYVMIIIIAGILAAVGWIIYTNYFVSTSNTANNAIENNKPLSLMDQELAKHKAKAQNQETQKNATEEDDEIDAAITKENKILSTVLLEIGRSEEPKNKNPKNPTKLTISKPTMITRITTDHFNGGMGTPRGGIITIKDRSGMVVAAYKAFGKTGRNGTPSAKWVAEPNKILNKGTYLIWDSDPQTWSKTLVGSNGFVVVEGYEVE